MFKGLANAYIDLMKWGGYVRLNSLELELISLLRFTPPSDLEVIINVLQLGLLQKMDEIGFSAFDDYEVILAGNFIGLLEEFLSKKTGIPLSGFTISGF